MSRAPREASNEQLKPSLREIDEAVVAAIGRGDIILPSLAAAASIIAKRIKEIRVEYIGDDLAPVVYGEKELLAAFVLRKIHHPNTRGLICGTADDGTPASHIRDIKELLVADYSTIGMANGQATAERHFRTIEGLAKKFVQEKYPQFAGHRTEVGG